MKKLSRQEMVLEIYDREAMGEVTAREIEIINRGLAEEYGEGGRLSPAQIARILIDEDLPVRFDEIFRMPSHNEAYETAFEGLSVNRTLEQAERSLTVIDRLFRTFSEQNDKTGVRYARQTAIRARENAAELAASESLSRIERLRQREIEEWFRIWLQTPEIFFIWLEARKATADYKGKFGPDIAVKG